VWRKDHTAPGLAMSRSMGDCEAQDLGVISVPDIMDIEITKNDRIIILASDGVWEMLTNEEVIEIVGDFYESGDAEKACDELIKIASKKWRSKDNVVDDITAIVIFLNGN